MFNSSTIGKLGVHFTQAASSLNSDDIRGSIKLDLHIHLFFPLIINQTHFEDSRRFCSTQGDETKSLEAMASNSGPRKRRRSEVGFDSAPKDKRARLHSQGMTVEYDELSSGIQRFELSSYEFKVCLPPDLPGIRSNLLRN